MISHSKKFYFVHVPKSAGTSIEEYFAEYQDVATGHMRLTDWIAECPGYFTFAVKRNVYERLVEMLFFKHGMFNRDRLIINIETYLEHMENTPTKIWTWEFGDTPVERLYTYHGDINWYCDGPIDYWIDFNDLEGGLKHVCEQLGIPFNPDIPHSNQSTMKSIDKKKVRWHYSIYYDDEIIDLVKKSYDEEIDKFGWVFDDQRDGHEY